MSLTSSVDQDSRRVRIRAYRVGAGQIAQLVIDMLRARPELATYDFLCEIWELLEDITTDELMAVKAAYDERADPQFEPITAIVTAEELLLLWSRGLDLIFTGRSHRLFRTAAEAEIFLDRARKS